MVTLAKNKDTSGVLIPGGLLIGLGIGMLYDQTAAGVLIGLGAGFIAMFIVQSKKK